MEKITNTEIAKVKNYFIKKKEKEITEEEIEKKFKLTPSKVRQAIGEIRYDKDINICWVGIRTYKYTTKDKELIERYMEKLRKQIKQKSIKYNILKRYCKK